MINFMKRLIAALFFLFPVIAFAQDRIKTIDGRTIEAKILEINDEVVYKEYNYQNGPTYRMKTDEIVSIVLENGTEKTYMNIPAGISYPSSISIKKGDVLGDGREISEDALPYILGTGSTLRKISTPLLIAGGASAGLGAIWIAVSATVLSIDANDEAAPAMITAGYVLIGAGLTAIATAVPLRIVSKSKFNSVVDDYNHKPHPQIAMGVTRNGIGVQLAF